MIPRIIHQTWKDHDVPEQFRAAQASWRALHPEWEYRFWTDGDLRALVRERAPEIASLYDHYPYAIQRVDAARYVILREIGGLYADLDLHCLVPFDDLLEHRVVLPRTTPFGLSNQLMMAEPGHPVFDRAVRDLPLGYARWHRFWYPRHVRVLASAGPLNLTGRVRAHGRVDGARILSLDEHCHGDPSRNRVRNLRGNTWASWDSRVINFFHDNWAWLTATGVVAAAGLAFLR
jgi:mannosyltransferase OCH1-like enzyme